jgi:hypothetical protein
MSYAAVTNSHSYQSQQVNSNYAMQQQQQILLTHSPAPAQLPSAGAIHLAHHPFQGNQNAPYYQAHYQSAGPFAQYPTGPSGPINPYSGQPLPVGPVPLVALNVIPPPLIAQSTTGNNFVSTSVNDDNEANKKLEQINKNDLLDRSNDPQSGKQVPPRPSSQPNSAPVSSNNSFSSNTASNSTTKSKLNPYAMEFNPTFGGASNIGMLQSPSPTLITAITPQALASSVQPAAQPIHQLGPTTALVVTTAGSNPALPPGAVPLSAMPYSAPIYDAYPQLPTLSTHSGHHHSHQHSQQNLSNPQSQPPPPPSAVQMTHLYQVPAQTIQGQPIIHTQYQTAGTGHQQQTTSILINGQQPYYFVNQPPPPTTQQQQQQTSSAASMNTPNSNQQQSTPLGNNSTHGNKVKKAVVSINDGNSNANTPTSNNNSLRNNSSNYSANSSSNNNNPSQPNQFHQMISYGPPQASLGPNGHQQQFIYANSTQPIHLSQLGAATASQSQFAANIYPNQAQYSSPQQLVQQQTGSSQLRMIGPNGQYLNYTQSTIEQSQQQQQQQPQFFSYNPYNQLVHNPHVQHHVNAQFQASYHPPQSQQQQNNSQQQQQQQNPPPSSTPSNVIHSHSAPHTPSPMPVISQQQQQQQPPIYNSTNANSNVNNSAPQQIPLPPVSVYQPQGPAPPHGYIQTAYNYMPQSPSASGGPGLQQQYHYALQNGAYGKLYI